MIFNLATAREYARQDRTEEWIQAYLNVAAWANVGLSAVIRHQKPLWIGPIEVELTQLVRRCGPEAQMRYRVSPSEWEASIMEISRSLEDPSALPPLIIRPEDGIFGLPDGNHRHEAMCRKGWRTGWVFLWCDRQEKFRGSWRAAD